MRFKRRYFCCELQYRDSDCVQNKLNKLKHSDISSTINKSIEKFYGDLGAAEMIPSFSVIYFNQNTNICILRTARNLEKKFHTMLTFIQKIENIDVQFKVVHKSGSIKKCKEFLIEYCSNRLLEFYQKTSSRHQKLDNDDQIIVNVLTNLIEACDKNDYSFN
ncbi:ribonuclease P MRP subunit POP5 [Brachionus plicatilis]|uniref:Ribonuclease P/MRP protein subunit POP5 n=1 Tax=Brachionus plicatilis TaxID=10195 RepID=A0A3M7STY4_BRAPC|nr:ribonuclease P MRP subunit POP5 [Brachionus plicatilis]